MNTVTVTLKTGFLKSAEWNLASEDFEKLIARREKTTKDGGVFALDAETYDIVREEATFQATYEDAENKLIAANFRRAGASALKALDEAGRPAAPKTMRKLNDTLYCAYDHFNKALFDNRLPPVVIVLHRKRSAHGYFWHDQWANKDGVKASEIALNPDSMSRDPKEVLSTLVHEMVHHEQQCFGDPSKTGHNVEWCELMERIGLTPIGVGNCEGKRSGANFTHEVVEGEAFDVAANKFLGRKGVEDALAWHSKPVIKARKQDRSKVRHSCRRCGTNIWGKEGITVSCCGEVMKPYYYI